MGQIKAFVGHSFVEEDRPVVSVFLDYFNQLTGLLPHFSWVHAEAAEPKELAEKVLALMEGGAEEITRVVIDAAKAGDLSAARLVLERLAPPLRERPLSITLPDVSDVAGVSAAQQAILSAVGEGDVLPSEATALAGVLEARRKAIETVELEARISALEARRGKK